MATTYEIFNKYGNRVRDKHADADTGIYRTKEHAVLDYLMMVQYFPKGAPFKVVETTVSVRNLSEDELQPPLPRYYLHTEHSGYTFIRDRNDPTKDNFVSSVSGLTYEQRDAVVNTLNKLEEE